MIYQFNTLTRDAGGTLVRKWRHLRSLPESHMTHSQACEVDLLYAVIHEDAVDPIPDVFEAVICPKHSVNLDDRGIWAKAFADIVRSYDDYFASRRATTCN